MKSSILVLFLMSSLQVISQNHDPMKTVSDLFLAMEKNDSSLAKKQFTEDALLFTILNDSTKGPVKTPASKLIEAFGTPKTDLWQEPFWNEVVQKDERFASVWVEYAFYLNGNLSHCGVDAFHMVYLNDRWKIFHLTDTRRTDCVIPQNISTRYGK